jgi:uncharacterized protein YcnI
MRTTRPARSTTRPARRITRLATVAALAAAAALGLAVPAGAHVTIAADDASRGAADSILTFRVPNEDDAAVTIKVDIKFPVKSPIPSVRPAAKLGWTVTTKTVTFNPPIKTDDGTITTGVGEVVYSATSPANGIGVGQFAAFQILVGPLPNVDALTFPTVQTYSNGKTQAWVEPVVDPANLPEMAAPVLTLGAAGSESSGSGGAAGAGKAPLASVAPSLPPATGPATGTASPSSDSTARRLGAAGLVVGVLGLLVAGLAVARGRRSETA